MVSINSKEFDKIIKIFGANELLNAYMTLKLKLTQDQLQQAINIKNGKSDTNEK